MWVIGVMRWVKGLPKGLRIVVYVVISVTIVGWILFILAQFIEILRKILHWITDRRIFWVGFYACVILAVGTFLVAQFVLKLGWWEKLMDVFNGWVKSVREMLGDKIRG